MTPIIIIGAIVLIIALAVIAVSFRRNAQGEEDGPLEARLAGVIERGGGASL